MHEVRDSVLDAVGSMGDLAASPSLLQQPRGCSGLLRCWAAESHLHQTTAPWGEPNEAEKQLICSDLARCIVLPLPGVTTGEAASLAGRRAALSTHSPPGSGASLQSCRTGRSQKQPCALQEGSSTDCRPFLVYRPKSELI